VYRAYALKHRAKNLDAMRAKDREWYSKNKERKSESDRVRREPIREQLASYAREYYREHRVIILARRAKEWIERGDELRAKQRTYRYLHPVQTRASARRARLKNPAQCLARCVRRRAILIGAAGSHTVAEWNAIALKQRGKCAHCGHKTKLTRDHKVPLSRGGTDFAFNLQGLCKPCNSRKGAKIVSNAHPSLFDRSDV
jgi:5-methylcytosine-specific restriction endonuclease McrA